VAHVADAQDAVQWRVEDGGNGHCHTADFPVEEVSWNTVQEFLSVTGMRLPIGAEWEYAYRAGTSTAYHGDRSRPGGTNDDGHLQEIAWHQGNSSGQVHAVGQRHANGLGLYYIAGNVWEFVQDWYSQAYCQHSPPIDPQGAPTGTARVVRGGSWYHHTPNCRASTRVVYERHVSDPDQGFRVARNP
jgi:formylglycine-generating enzyme required for sulfatase activity